MAPKHHPTLLSGGDRKALKKELSKARGVTLMLAWHAADLVPWTSVRDAQIYVLACLSEKYCVS
jgi:hypothetical protein